MDSISLFFSALHRALLPFENWQQKNDWCICQKKFNGGETFLPFVTLFKSVFFPSLRFFNISDHYQNMIIRQSHIHCSSFLEIGFSHERKRRIFSVALRRRIFSLFFCCSALFYCCCVVVVVIVAAAASQSCLVWHFEDYPGSKGKAENEAPRFSWGWLWARINHKGQQQNVILFCSYNGITIEKEKSPRLGHTATASPSSICELRERET